MSLPKPPADLDRKQRRTFRTLVSQLVDRGVDPVSRASFAAEICRLEARLNGLRQAEREAAPDKRNAAARATTQAAIEHRRLTQAMFVGSKRQAADPEPGETEADRAWRQFIHHDDRTFTEAELTARHGVPSWPALLHATHAEAVEEDRALELAIRREGSRGWKPEQHGHRPGPSDARS